MKKKLSESILVILKEDIDTVGVDKVAKFIEDSVNTLQTTNYTNCRLVLDHQFAIYVGWSDGYDETDTSVILSKESPTYGINAAVKERNDADWADLDYLDFPYDPESGEVWDCSISIGPNEDYMNDARWLLDEYKEMKKAVESGEYILN